MVAWYFVFYIKIDNSDLSVSDCFGKSMDLVSEAGWLKIFLFVIIITVPVSIVNTFTYELASLILFPFVSMMQIEAYMLVLDKEEPQHDTITDNTENI